MDTDNDPVGLDEEMPIGKMEGEILEHVIDEDPQHVMDAVQAGALSITDEAMDYLTLCLESD